MAKLWTEANGRSTQMFDINKFLGMSEDEQVRYLFLRGYQHIAKISGSGALTFTKNDETGKVIAVFRDDGSQLEFDKHALADLAFRLRDEARKIDLGATLRAGMFAVYNIHHGHGIKWRDTDYKLFRWFATQAKPEHWIAAAIAAKETK